MNHTPEQTTPTNPAAVVEQVDRDAAADFVRWQRKATDEWKGPDGETDVWQFFHKDFSRGIRQGIWDEHPIAQAFARHRLLGIEQGRAEMREEVVKDFRWRERQCRTNPDAFDTAAAAIWAFAAEAMESSK